MSVRAEGTEGSPNAAWLDGVTSPVPGMEVKPQGETVPAPPAEERRLPGIPPSDNATPELGPPKSGGEGTPPLQIQKPPPPGAIPPAKKPEKLEQKPATPPRDPGTITSLPVHNPVIELIVAPAQTDAVRGSEAAFLPQKEPGDEAKIARWLIPSEPSPDPDGIVTQIARWDVPQLRIGTPGAAEKSAGPGPVSNDLPPASLPVIPQSNVQSPNIPTEAGGFPAGFFSHSPEILTHTAGK